MKIGSLCSGYGGLDMAVESYFNAKTVWAADIDKASDLVIRERWKIPNLGDLKLIEWEKIESVEILTAGYPCQPFSNAGKRKGINDPRHLWPFIYKAISILRPKVVVLENVRGHFSLGFREVLGNLAEIGYDARWELVRASDAGAPHRRERLFIKATSADTDSFTRSESRRIDRKLPREREEVLDGSDREIDGFSGEIITNSISSGSQRRVEKGRRYEQGGETFIDADSRYEQGERKMSGLGRRFTSRFDLPMRDVPDPLDQDSRLSVRFVEYMMGLNEGFITDLDLSRTQMLKMLGNGVVPQQAELALELMSQ